MLGSTKLNLCISCPQAYWTVLHSNDECRSPPPMSSFIIEMKSLCVKVNQIIEDKIKLKDVVVVIYRVLSVPV